MFWKARPYRNQVTGIVSPGKIHKLNDTGDRSLCGKACEDYPGDFVEEEHREINCKKCLQTIDAEKRHAQWEIEVQQRQIEEQQRQIERQKADVQWWREYNAYLSSPEWKARRALVLQRAKGRCEGCGTASATDVHHVTYDRVYSEMLFDLLALCRPCHQILHPNKQLRDLDD
jgi:5-methylcytosine-specific restriction endonuclease McrA